MNAETINPNDNVNMNADTTNHNDNDKHVDADKS